MKKYFDSIIDTLGKPVAGASIYVYDYGTSNLSATFSDSAGAIAKTNPVTTDAYGYFDFYAADGRYSITISGDGFDAKTITDILLEDTSDASDLTVSNILLNDGNLSFSGSNQRITGDFSSTTQSNRVILQSNVANGTTVVPIMPNGSSTIGGISIYNSSDPSNTNPLLIQSLASEARFNATKTGNAQDGLGSYLPITFRTNDLERMRIDTNGNVGVGVAPSAWGTSTLFRGVDIQGGAFIGVNTTSGNTNFGANLYNASAGYLYKANGYACTVSVAPSVGNVSLITYANNVSGAGATGVIANTFTVNQTDCVMTTATGGLGYGTGAGGTVTQATSRATAVTLNKPTGQITMFTAAGSATPSFFTVNNSLVAATDTVIVNIRSGASNYYVLQVGVVSAGSFVINFWSQSGTSSDTPIINFAVIKGATA